MDWEISMFGYKDWLAVWNVEFHYREERRETLPSLVQAGGSYSCRVESAQVSFCAEPGSIQVDQWGQLSSVDGRFYHVRVSYIDLAQGHVIVSGEATRRFYRDEHR